MATACLPSSAWTGPRLGLRMDRPVHPGFPSPTFAPVRQDVPGSIYIRVFCSGTQSRLVSLIRGNSRYPRNQNLFPARTISSNTPRLSRWSTHPVRVRDIKQREGCSMCVPFLPNVAAILLNRRRSFIKIAPSHQAETKSSASPSRFRVTSSRDSEVRRVPRVHHLRRG